MNNLHYRSLSIAPRDGDSPFVDAAAVDAWDAWFRWRDYGVLRDLTVDATWDRVATALASVETADSAAMWKRRFVDGFAAWQLLLDERILATAGTEKNAWSGDGLVAVLNVAAFVRAPSTMQASFDQTAFEELAALAVRALDDAAVLAGSDAFGDGGFRIGIVGLMDAFVLLGFSYDSAGGHALAALVAQTLARGCHRGASQLTRERGGSVPCTDAWRARALAQDIAPEVVAEAVRRGIRHSRLTAITSQSKLALFANNISDAIDPFADVSRSGPVLERDAQRVASARNHAAALSRQTDLEVQGLAADRTTSVAAQLKLRAAIQNWIDEPIGYPLLVDSEPDAKLSTHWAAMAAELGLPRTGWRKSSQRVDRYSPTNSIT